MGESIPDWKARFASILRRPRTGRVAIYALAAILLLCGLWLPPISLGNRLFHLNYPLVTANGGSVQADNGATLTIPQGALTGKLRLLMTAVDPGDPAASKGPIAEALKVVPANLQVLGPLYRFDAHGGQPQTAALAAPMPNGLGADGLDTPTDALDLYAWTGTAWEWLPSATLADTAQVKATLSGVPQLVAFMESKPQGLQIGVSAPDIAAVNAAPLDLASELYIAGLSLGADGSVTGEITLDEAPDKLTVLPILSNRVNDVVHADWVANLIESDEARTAHIAAIVEAVERGGYRGVSLQYEAIDASLREPFTTFVAELAGRLHDGGRLLAVRVDEPKPTAEGGWDTAGYDWAALGRVADMLRIPVLNDIDAYGPDGAMEQCLRQTVNVVDRQKIQLVVSANSIDRVGDTLRALCYGDALSLASQQLVVEDDNVVLPGETLSVRVANLASGLQETEAGQVWFAYKDSSGKEHKVWIEDASSIAPKLTLAKQFRLRGVTIDDLAGTANDARIWETVRVNRTPAGRGEPAPTVAEAPAQRYSVVWKVQSEDGQVVEEGVSPIDQPVVNWKAVDAPGDYVLTVAISEDGGQTALGSASSVEVLIPTPTPSPSPTPTAAPTAAPKPGGSAAPPPVSAPPPAPAGRVGFGYGIQVDMLSDGNHDNILGHVQALGFGWIKQQVEWFRFNPAPGQYDWGGLDRIVDNASARGIRVMFSVCKAPAWARPGDDDKSVAGPPADPNTYAEFMKAMADRYKGRVQAYEIWNEQNLWYEWGGRGGRLNAGNYVRLLSAAYHAIKSVDPGAIVISGALTPTGVNDGDIAIDDQTYLRQMYDAGLRGVCDAIGAHPSGYNNPPDADWRTWSDPTTGRAKGHPSWFFRSTMEGYRNTMVAYGDAGKRIIPTEFGWASVDGLGTAPAPGYEYAADNTAGEQAQFITRAYEMGRNWGFVGPMFLWNLNFAPICGAGDEKAAFGIVDCGWGARPAFHALASMPK